MYMRRAACAAVMEKVAEEEPWFGIEQEYYILDPATKWPLGWSGYFDPKTSDLQHAAVELTKMEASTVQLQHGERPGGPLGSCSAATSV